MFDASPCLTKYRQTSDPSEWDSKNKDHDPNYNFNANIRAATCGQAWLESTLASLPASDWKIVVGHELAYEITEFDLVAMLAKYNVDLYLNGHAHRLSHYTINGRNFVTSGAGSMDSTDTPDPSKSDVVFHFDNNTVPGFTGHFFEDDYNSLHTHFYDQVLTLAPR